MGEKKTDIGALGQPEFLSFSAHQEATEKKTAFWGKTPLSGLTYGRVDRDLRRGRT